MYDIEKQQDTSFVLRQALCVISKPLVNSNWSYSPETPDSGQNRRFFFVPCDLEIWPVTLKNNRPSRLCNVKVFALFCSHQRILTGVAVRKCSIRVKIVDFLSRVTSKFDGWPWKTTEQAHNHYLNQPWGNPLRIKAETPYIFVYINVAIYHWWHKFCYW